uniref:Uncharacterized protein n=1 Tax=Opuntia streptacantha TaxID=393608 RepID=A0A7C8Z600_OPUST
MFINPVEVLDVSLPTSFTALLSNCCADTEPGLAEEPTVPDLGGLEENWCRLLVFIGLVPSVKDAVNFLKKLIENADLIRILLLARRLYHSILLFDLSSVHWL